MIYILYTIHSYQVKYEMPFPPRKVHEDTRGTGKTPRRAALMLNFIFKDLVFRKRHVARFLGHQKGKSC